MGTPVDFYNEYQAARQELERARLDMRNAYAVVAILVKRAGGEVRITESEMLDVDPDTVFESYASDHLRNGDVILRVRP